MKKHDQFLIDLLKESLSRTEYSKLEQKTYLESLMREFEPASLRTLITSLLSVDLENLQQVSGSITTENKDKGWG